MFTPASFPQSLKAGREMKFRIALAVFLLFALAGSCTLHYYLPRKELVTVTEVSSKRAEGIPVERDRADDSRPLDIYYIFVVDEAGDSRVFSNVNTAWGFPPYFKFDSADMQAKAASLAGKRVVIRYYGMRVQILNLFPNITSLQPGDESSSLISWVRLSVFGLGLFILILIFPRYLSFFYKK
jgi:hypothetical protein